MPVTPQDLLDSAKRFDASKTNCEADYRACVSRVYYAAYHSAQEFHKNLSQPGISIAGCGMHKSFVNQLQYPGITKTDPDYNKSIEAGHYLKKMLFNRTTCDYDNTYTIAINSVTLAFADAELVFDAVK